MSARKGGHDTRLREVDVNDDEGEEAEEEEEEAEEEGRALIKSKDPTS